MKIVLTGGPSAGKTSALEILHRAATHRAVVVQEAASLLFRGGFPRKPEAPFVQCQQRAIFYVQKELEEIARQETQGKAVICDRGSLDGLAYWPGTEQSFFDSVGSSWSQELVRYDWVLHLDTAPPSGYKSTSLRLELESEAWVLNEKVKQVWSRHPRRVVIPNGTSFINKLGVVIKVVNMILDQVPAEDIRAWVGTEEKEKEQK